MEPGDYSLKMEGKVDFLLVRAYGKRTRDNVIKITSEVFQEAVQAKKAKVLIDVRELTGRLGVIDDYYLVTDLFSKLRGKGIQKAAIIDVRESPIHEWFLELVAQNRCYNFKVFLDEETAINWLKQ